MVRRPARTPRLSGPPRVRRGIAILAAGIALVLTGCAGIPSDGEVTVGQPDSVDQDLDFDFLPSGPQKGATQQEILTGFIDAASSPQNNYKIAREFLTSGAVWSPSANVTVDQGLRSLQPSSDSGVTLSVTPVAVVDGGGSYEEVTSSTPLSLDYRFVEQNGEWRISQLPAGVVIDRETFDQVFSAHALYFFDPDFTSLVPDVRWYPSSADSGTSTTIVRNLLAGPTAWLSGAVSTAFPSGTALDSDAVPIVDQQADVDLNAAALEADTREWQLMRLQLERSLAGVASITSVSLSVEQNVVDIAVPLTEPGIPRVDARPLVIEDGRFGFLSGGTVTELPGLSAAVQSVAPTAVSLGAGQDVAAVRGSGGVSLATPTGTTLLDQRQDLVAPALDPLGFVWSVPGDDPGALVAYSTLSGAAVQIPTTWQEAESITAIALSRDGTRLLGLVTDGAQSILLAAGIQRSEAGTPTGIGETVTLFTSSSSPVATAWIDEQTAAVVLRDAQGVDTVWSQQLGGTRTSLGTTRDTVAAAGGNTASQLRLLTGAGELQQQRGVAWQSVDTGLEVLGVQNRSAG